MGDPLRMYEAGRKAMYAAMELHEEDEDAAGREYDAALKHFEEFSAISAKSRGMYRELDKKTARMVSTVREKLETIGLRARSKWLHTPRSAHNTPRDTALPREARDPAPKPASGVAANSLHVDVASPTEPETVPSSNGQSAPAPTSDVAPPTKAPAPGITRAGSASGSSHPTSMAAPAGDPPQRLNTGGESLQAPATRSATPVRASLPPKARVSTASDAKGANGRPPRTRRRFLVASDSDSDDSVGRRAPRAPANPPGQGRAQASPAAEARMRVKPRSPQSAHARSTPAAARRRALRVDSDSGEEDQSPARTSQLAPKSVARVAPGARDAPAALAGARAQTPLSAARKGVPGGAGAPPLAGSLAARTPLVGRAVRREESEGGAKVLRVDPEGGGDFASIRGAVEAAADGQTVEIAGGEYAEMLVLQHPIELRAAVDGAVALVASAGETLVTCASAGVRLVGLSLQQTGGDPARRGRSSVRAVEALSGALRLERCTVRSEAGSGIIAADAGIVSLEACTLQGSGKCGLLVFDGGSAAVNSSTLAGNGLYGLVVQNGGTAEADGSRFRGNKHAGILAHGRGSACAARGSDVSANGEMGVGVQNGAEVRLERTRVAGNIHAGLFVDGEASRAVVKDADVSENSVRGVGVQSGGEVHMQGSRVCANSQEGVFVSGARSQVTLLDNDIASNGTKGVGVQSAAAALLIGNRVQSNAEEGVFVSDPGSQVTVRDSNVSRNEMKGIGVQSGGQAEVDGNLICANQREGLYVSGAGSKALAHKNEITQNGVKGVGIQDGADVVVEANRIAGNQYVGVHVYGRGSRALVQGNDICDNSLAAVVSEHEGVVQSSGNRIDGVHERDLALPSGAEASLDASGPPRTPAASSLLPRPSSSSSLPPAEGAAASAAGASLPRGAAARPAGASGAAEARVDRETCRIGEKLWVIDDAAELRRLTEDARGVSWNDDMAECCGSQGEVVAILDHHAGIRFQAWVSWCIVYGALRRRP